MRIFHGFDSLPRFIHPAVTVGSYDGVHLGHQALIRTLKEEALRNGGESIVVTFEPHPRIALGRAEGMRLLTSLDEKAELLARAGVDNLVVIPFDREFARLTGEEFMQEFLIRRLGIETLVAGYNHRFGHDRRSCEDLKDRGVRIVRVEACDVDGQKVSSTVIRRLWDEGRIEEAERLLGHPLKSMKQNTK